MNQVLNLQQPSSKPQYEHQHIAVTTLLSGSEFSTQTEDNERRITARETSFFKKKNAKYTPFNHKRNHYIMQELKTNQ